MRYPAIIYRDLTAKNVLLTSSLTAKITDMENTRIVDDQLVQRYTEYPGTLVYMSPEALNSQDIYIYIAHHLISFHLATLPSTQLEMPLQLNSQSSCFFLQIYPRDLPAPTYTAADDSIRGRSEVEHRDRYIKEMESQIGSLQPHLVQLVKDCLHNTESKRPTTEQLLLKLQLVNEACGKAERETQ